MSTNTEIDELLKRKDAYEKAEAQLEYAQAAVSDSLKHKCLTLGKQLGAETGRDFADMWINRKENQRVRIGWNEYHQYQVYDSLWVELPAEYLDLSDQEFDAQISTIAAASALYSECLESKQRHEQEREEDERREFERLKTKYT